MTLILRRFSSAFSFKEECRNKAHPRVVGRAYLIVKFHSEVLPSFAHLSRGEAGKRVFAETVGACAESAGAGDLQG